MVHNFVVVFDKYIVEGEEKETAEQISSADTSPLAPYAIVSSTNSKAQVPNPNTAREAVPTFSPFCGHVIPANGGTRMQFGEALFRPNCPVIRCEHCQQLIPSTTITPHQPTSHIPVDQQLSYTHASSYTPASGSDTRSSIATNRTDYFADFKAASFQKALLTAQKGRQSSNITINSGQPSASVSQQHNSTKQRNRKINQSEKTIPRLDDHPLSPPLSVVHKYSLKLIISHFNTPFKLEAVPHSEEWSPTTEELKHIINGIYCTSTFGHII